MSKKMVSVSATSLGGFCGTCIRLNIQNNTAKAIEFTVDPALIFRPADIQYQDLVLLGSEKVALQAGEQRAVLLNTFCGKSYAHAPVKDIPYEFIKQGDSNMIKTLQFGKLLNLTPNLLQYAVWTFTNNHPLSTIYDYYNPSSSDTLLKYVAALRHMKVPDYRRYAHTDRRVGHSVYSRDSEKIYVDMRWGYTGYRHMYLSVYDGNGELYKNIDADREMDKNGYHVRVMLDPKREKKGTYKVRLHDDALKIWDEKTVEIE